MKDIDILVNELYSLLEEGSFNNKRIKELKKELRSKGVLSLPFSTNPKKWFYSDNEECWFPMEE